MAGKPFLCPYRDPFLLFLGQFLGGSAAASFTSSYAIILCLLGPLGTWLPKGPSVAIVSLKGLKKLSPQCSAPSVHSAALYNPQSHPHSPTPDLSLPASPPPELCSDKFRSCLKYIILFSSCLCLQRSLSQATPP